MKTTSGEESEVDGTVLPRKMTATTDSEETDEEGQLTCDIPKNNVEMYEDTRCGWGSCQPSWLQIFASKKTYVAVYSTIGVLERGIGSYASAVISTLEKRFKISSRTSGLIMSAVDIGFLSCCIWMAYLGNRGHKTRWVSAGIFMIACSCFLRYLPHLIFGVGQDALSLTLEGGASLNSSGNVSNFSESEDASRAFLCKSDVHYEEDCSFSSSSVLPASVLFVASAVFGAGTSMYNTLGIAYLDDNVRKNKSPFLIAIVECIRMLGPTVGFLLGSYALQLYVDPGLHPTITDEDPRWIGAWWFGWLPMSIAVLILTAVLCLFPKRLPRAAKRNQTECVLPKPSFSDFKNVMKRLIQNKVLVLNSLSAVFFMFGVEGFWIFMPKYMETQFRQSASQSSLLTGSVGIIFSALGIMASGTVISVFKPSARNIAAWNVIVEGLEAFSYILYAFLGCTIEDLHGSPSPDGSWDLTSACNAHCDCGPDIKYFPVCSLEDNVTYYSPCHAGCTSIETVNGTKMFGNCSCIPGEDGMVIDGVCPADCVTQFVIFLAFRSVMTFLSSSGRAGNMIVQFRCVDPEDKALSICFTEVLLCTFTYIPAPIAYGILLDSACMVWGQTCEQTGNCWWYDGQKMAFLLNFTAFGLVFIGTLLDVGVWYYVKDLQMYDENKDGEDKTKHKNNSPNTEILQ